MENESNSLLELPLESSEILEEVNLGTNDVDVTDASVGHVGEMLIDESAAANISCMESNSIDFEFVHSDLGNTTDFNIDHASVFGITDNEIDAREDCDDIFRDSACFNETVSKQNDAGTGLQNGLVSVPSFGKANLYRDLGLKLQVIPLNNLQYVSTIQTSRGLHILAIPAQTSVSSNYEATNAHQISQKTKQCLNLDINQSLGGLLVNRIQTKMNEMPNLQVDTVTKKKLAEKAVEKGESFKGSSRPSNKKQVKSTSFPHSTRKARNAVDKKLAMSGKNALHKGYVQRILTEGRVIKGRKTRTLYIDVVKSPKLRKHKMVSLLKASMTNKLKQVSNTSNTNTGTADKKEIKLTFHLKPSKDVPNTKDGNHEKPAGQHCEKTGLKSDTECFIQKRAESFNNKTPCIDQCVTSGKLQYISDEGIFKGHENSDPPEVLRNNTVKLPEISDQKLEIDTLSTVHKGSYTLSTVHKGSYTLSTVHKDSDTLLTVHKETSESGRRYQCNFCLSTFCRKGHYNNHLKTHKEITTVAKMTGGEITEKNEKEQQMQEKDTLEKDATLSHAFNSKTSEEIESKFLKCEFCGMEFKTKGNLIRHKLTHNLDMKEKVQGRYNCDECNKYFMQKCDLKRHIATHSGTFPYVCTVCNKGFIRRSDLRIHEKFHTQEKRYKCQVCSKAYFQTGDLSRHMRQNHSDLCQFACQNCGKKYLTQKTLNLHMKAKH